jgi:hypothetical protein
MIMLAVWVLLFVAVGIAAHLFGVDSRDADYSVRVTPRAMPSRSAHGVALGGCPSQAAKRIR